MEIIRVQGDDLKSLLDYMAVIVRRDDVHTLHFTIQMGQVKIKVNENMWTIGYGPLAMESNNA